jgi:hypothetical protein
LKIRIATLSLTILCLALTAYAGTTTFYNDGGIDGNDNGFFISGPNLPNPAGSFQDISDGFILAASGTANKLEFGEWVLSGSTPTGVDWEGGPTAFSSAYSGHLAQNSTNSVLLFTNGFGYGIYDVTATVNIPNLTAGNEYWITLSNATNTGSSQTGAWDLAGPSGGPATCNFRQSGTDYGSCGTGGESFTLSGVPTTTTPEPSSILLLGSGILGLAGVLRRKLTR